MTSELPPHGTTARSAIYELTSQMDLTERCQWTFFDEWYRICTLLSGWNGKRQRPSYAPTIYVQDSNSSPHLLSPCQYAPNTRPAATPISPTKTLCDGASGIPLVVQRYANNTKRRCVSPTDHGAFYDRLARMVSSTSIQVHWMSRGTFTTPSFRRTSMNAMG